MMMTHRSRIAVVDDDHRMLESLDELLVAAGYEVVPFASGGSFLEADCTHDIDCLITDVEMPEMNGWELMSSALSLRRNLPIMMITGYDAATPKDVERTPLYRFFRKPFDGAEFLVALAELIALRQ